MKCFDTPFTLTHIFKLNITLTCCCCNQLQKPTALAFQLDTKVLLTGVLSSFLYPSYFPRLAATVCQTISPKNMKVNDDEAFKESIGISNSLNNEDQSVQVDETSENAMEKHSEDEHCTDITDRPISMSKKEMKRQHRREHYREVKKIKKQKKKEEKRLQREANEALDKALDRQEENVSTRSDNQNESVSPSESMTNRKRLKKEEFAASCVGNFHVVIDCAWEHKHNETALKSLSQQIMFSYGANRRQPRPVTLHLSGLGERTRTNLEKVSFEKWAGVTWSPSDYLSCPQYSTTQQEGKKQLIYLTADSEETLQDLDVDCAYIIGGIVDRNRLKGATLRKAQEGGVKTARLPIQQHFALQSSTVLTVNHVFEILVRFGRCRDWGQAIGETLPMRKGPAPKAPISNKEGETEDTEEETPLEEGISTLGDNEAAENVEGGVGEE